MKTLEVNNKQNFIMLPTLEGEFPFEGVDNEICIGETDADRQFEQIYLDGPNDSKLMITFQYSDGENNFLDDNIYYSEQIEVKEEIECANEVVISSNDIQSTFGDLTHIPIEAMEVQNEVVIERDENDTDAYGEIIQNLMPSIKKEVLSTGSHEDTHYRKRKKHKDGHVKEPKIITIPNIKVETPDKPKSLFGSSMGVSRCNICNKYTKRSCYEAHMKEHFEADMAKANAEEESLNPSSISPIDERSDTSNDNDILYNNSFIGSFSHEEEVVDQKFICDQCEFFAFTQDDLDYHMKIHECQKTNKCPYCDYSSAQIITMKAHIKSHESSNSFECNKCTYRTTERAHFTRHMRRHTGDKPFKCSLCMYSAVQGSALKSHLRRHYGEKPHQCPYCEYRSVERTSLVRHVRVHTGEKPHACPYCDYKSIQKSSLKAHLRKHNGEHHECNKCEYKTIQKTCLSRHLKRHNPEKPHKCKICDYQSVQKASLRTHMRRHNGEKPYQCPNCEYSCVEKTHLNRHLRQHTGEKPIFCFVCDYRCIQFSSLVSHYKRHEGIVIQCSFCDFKTVRTDVIIGHLKAEHKGMWSTAASHTFGCPLCEHKASSEELLNSHMSKHMQSFAEDAANAVQDKFFKCAECEFKTISRKLLKTHRKSHKEKYMEELI